MRLSRAWLVLCGLILSCSAVLAFAQAAPPGAKAAITGTVSDESGAGLKGATVVADNGSGKASPPSVTTDDQGLYAITDLPAGTYTISVNIQGNKIFQAKVVLSPGQVLTMSVAGSPAPQPDAPVVAAQAGPPAQGSPVQVAQGSLAQSAPANPAPASQSSPSQVQASPAPAAQASRVQAAQASPGQAQSPSANTATQGVAQAGSAQNPQPTQSSSGLQQLPDPWVPRMPILASASGNGSGAITGAVTDQTGAALTGATVEAVKGGAVVQTTKSDERGNYTLTGLSPGTYTVNVTVNGFKQWQADSIPVGNGQILPIDAVLTPAGEKTQVTVAASNTAEVETETAQVAGTVTEKEVLSLGLNGRNFTQLIALTPGVSNQTGQDEAKVGVTGSVKYSVNGGRVEYNTFEVDGSDVLNAGLNGAESTLMVYPSLDAIQEVKVLTSNYGAMYGRTASGTVMVTTKSGGEHWHGVGYEFLRNEAFNARNYFDVSPHRPKYRRNDFGYTVGGPLSIPGFYNRKKDKTFVFFSQEFRYENSPTDQQPTFNRAVPSFAERSGDFNDVCPTPDDPSNPGNGQFYASRWPDCPRANSLGGGIYSEFANNNLAIKQALGTLDPNALALLSTNLLPLPNSSVGCNSTTHSCYVATISEPTYWREELFRLDHNFSTKLKGTFRYIHDEWNTVVPVPQWQHLPGNVVNSFPTVQNRFVGPGVSLVGQITQPLSSTFVNQFTASFTNAHITLNNVEGPGGANLGRPSGIGQPGGPCRTGTSDPNDPLGEGFTSCPMGAIFNNGFGGKAPGIVIGGSNAAYGGAGFTLDTSYMPWEHSNPTYSIRDDVSIALKKHTLQFGVQAMLAQRNQTNEATAATPGDVQGLLVFSNVNGGRTNTGNAFANFLTLSNFTSIGPGNAIQSFTQDSTQSRYYNSYHIVEPFIQDDWKITSRLTLNLGVRISLFDLYHEKYLRAYNWDPAHFDRELASTLGVDPTTGQLISRPSLTPIPLDPANPDPRLLNGIVQCGVNGVPSGCMKGHMFNPAPRIGFAWDPRGDGRLSIRGGYGIFFEHGTGAEANTGSLEASAPAVLSMTQNFPSSYGCIGGSNPTCKVQAGAYPLNVTAIPTKAVWPYAQQWSFSIQRELPKSMVATVAYVGSKGTHLTVERQLNQLQPISSQLNPFGLNEPILPIATVAGKGDCIGFQAPTASSKGTFQLNNGTTVSSQDPAFVNLEAACVGSDLNNPTPDTNTLRPYPGIGQIFSLENIADSSYNALQVSLRRTAGPLSAGISYAYSHSLDDSSDRSDATFVNSFDLRSNHASSNFDQRHLLNVSYIYELPLAHIWPRLSQWGHDDGSGNASTELPAGDSKFQRAMLEGWEISGIAMFQSGTPFSVINGASSTVSVLDNAGVANGIGAASYPDLATGPVLEAIGGKNSKSFGPILGNPNRFVAPRGLTFGNAGRNFMNNPSRLNFDMSLLKRFPISEGTSLQLRVEGFNLFNHTQFRIYDPNYGNTGSNVISCYGGPNYTAGFSAPGGADCLTGNSFLHPVNAHRARTLQLGIKLMY